MSKSPYRVRMAMRRAEKVLSDHGVTALPTDPFAIATAVGIFVQPKRGISPGVAGMLLRHGETFGILYAKGLYGKGFERFCVGHELGHYFLDGHIDLVLPPGEDVHSSHAMFESTDQYEREADHFSAGLLMPSTPCRRLLDRCEVGLASIESMANRCQTSMTATAIRYVSLTTDAVAVIVSSGAAVDFCFLSDTMKALPDLTWLRKGSPLPRGSATLELNRNPDRVRQVQRVRADCDLLDWLGGSTSAGATEEAIGLGRYAKSLTVISCPSITDATFDDEEEDLEDAWAPRFR